MVKSW
jgi:hypothetical protein